MKIKHVLLALAVVAAGCKGQKSGAPGGAGNLEVVNLIGTPTGSPEWKSFEKQVGRMEVQHLDDCRCTYYNAKPHGVSMIVDDGTQAVHSATVYAAGEEGYQPYQGRLPYGLAVTDNRLAVQRKIGEPETKSNKVYTYAGYPSKGITVMYSGENMRDSLQMVRYIVFEKRLE